VGGSSKTEASVAVRHGTSSFRAAICTLHEGSPSVEAGRRVHSFSCRLHTVFVVTSYYHRHPFIHSLSSTRTGCHFCAADL
jgi:hypothetical protein